MWCRQHLESIANVWNSSSTPSSPSGLSPVVNEAFPAGFYAISTFLDTVTTNCTANAATWSCYPYETYAQSASGALATFNWVIAQSSSGYNISSTRNPFALSFTNTSLTLMDPGSENEHYTFSVLLDKYVVPSSTITSDGSMAGCFFNNTQLVANLYTNRASSYPANSNSSATATSSATASTTASSEQGLITSETFHPWPFAVDVIQSVPGGAGIPDCYHVDHGNIGIRVAPAFLPQPSHDSCACAYKNYAPSKV